MNNSNLNGSNFIETLITIAGSAITGSSIGGVLFKTFNNTFSEREIGIFIGIVAALLAYIIKAITKKNQQRRMRS